MRNKAARGNCYAAAYALLGLYADRGAVLCHGVAIQTAPPYARMGHAWVEIGGACYDGLFPYSPIPRACYYRAGNVEADSVRRYSPSAARLARRRHRNYGPWCPVIAAAAHRND